MSTKDRKESLLERVAERLLVGSGPEVPFLVRHDWAIPAVVFTGCGLFAVLVLVASFQGWGRVLMWTVIGIGALCVVLMIPTFVRMFRATRGPLPALDRTPRTARVTLRADDADGGQTILVEYLAMTA